MTGLILPRRGFLAGLLAAPAIVRAASIMPVRVSPGLVPWRPVMYMESVSLAELKDIFWMSQDQIFLVGEDSFEIRPLTTS